MRVRFDKYLLTFLCGSCCWLTAQALELNAPDLSPLAKIEKATGRSIRLIQSNMPQLPIVVAKKPKQRDLWGAEFLLESLEQMTGNKAEFIKSDKKLDRPAIYIGNLPATKEAGFSSEGMEPGEFAVKTKDSSIYLFGNDTTEGSFGSHYAALDFAERVLDVREYFPPKHGGRAVKKTGNLVVPPLNYGDKPLFPNRNSWPYLRRKSMQTLRIANTHPHQLIVHAPHNWHKDQDYRKNRPEIFQLEKDGTRTLTPMLCYGNPRTLETYLERIEEELQGKRKSGLMRGKTVTVSPWDMGVNCFCSDCRKLFDAEGPYNGRASKILCTFVRKLSDILAKKHPELTIIYLPYANYCAIPEGTEFPAGNVEVQLCTMPGLAMLKDPRVKKYEEELIRNWAKVSKRKIQNWHYSCWPAEFTNAPYIYADACVQHYKDTKDWTVGSFINGSYPECRLTLSAYVWNRALWNPELNCEAIFDEFAKRLFGPAAKPMRRIVQLQAEGWKRPWEVAKVSPKNIFEVSYPRAEVVEMEKCFEEAYTLAGKNEEIKKRIDYYKGGFTDFFVESKEHAEGTAFAPLMIQKVAANPVVDGKLDEADWKLAEPLSFVRARDRKVKEPKYPTEIKAVWTPEGVTFGFRLTEPTPDKLCIKGPAGDWHNDNVELFLDVSGKGAGNYYQLIMDARDEGVRAVNDKKWNLQGVKSKTFRGKDFWSAEIFIPYSAFAGSEDVLKPTTSANGVVWLGNFTRHRVADCREKDKAPDSTSEMTRLNTRYSIWSADQNAFGKLQFKE